MAYSRVRVPQRVRQCGSHCTVEESTRSADRHGLDLVGRSNEFRESSESKKAVAQAAGPGRAFRTLSCIRGEACAPHPPGLNHLPRNQARDSENQFAYPRNQGKRKSSVTGNAKEITNEHVAALLHAKGPRHWEHCRTDRENHALKDNRVDDGRSKPKCVKCDPNFARSDDQRCPRPHTASDHAASPGVEREDGI